MGGHAWSVTSKDTECERGRKSEHVCRRRITRATTTFTIQARGRTCSGRRHQAGGRHQSRCACCPYRCSGSWRQSPLQDLKRSSARPQTLRRRQLRVEGGVAGQKACPLPSGPLCDNPLELGGEQYTVGKHFSNSFQRPWLKIITVKGGQTKHERSIT